MLRRLAAACLSTPLVLALGVLSAPAASDALAISISGNHLVDAAGRTIQLLGVNRSGTEFKCIQGGDGGNRGWGLFDGPTDVVSGRAIASWNANAVRVPLNEDCWLGLNGVNPEWGGQAYREAIAGYVANLHGAGLYALLDLHWNAPGSAPAAAQQPMPDLEHSVDFWKSVASRFKNDHAVLFDLYNEPFIFGSYLADSTQDPWSCWLNGCGLNQYLTGDGSHYTQNANWRAAGMQALIDAVRSTGATQPVLASGLDWANDVSGWLSHRPNDPAHQLAASWHSYPKQGCSSAACWNDVVQKLAAQVPVVVGETGDSVCESPTFNPDFLPWADAHGVSYLGWTWNTWGDCDNVLIKDYSGTPTTNYGTFFRDHLKGRPTQPSTGASGAPAPSSSGATSGLGPQAPAPASPGAPAAGPGPAAQAESAAPAAAEAPSGRPVPARAAPGGGHGLRISNLLTGGLAGGAVLLLALAGGLGLLRHRRRAAGRPGGSRPGPRV